MTKLNKGLIMNIFILDSNIKKCAQSHCDQHVVKMILEITQILSTNAHILNLPFKPYKPTHQNHPCTKWARKSYYNYNWLSYLGFCLCEEYTFRYKKIHKCESYIRSIFRLNHEDTDKFPQYHATNFVLAMPDEYKVYTNPVRSYRNYYIGEKAKFAKYNKGRDAPEWFSLR